MSGRVLLRGEFVICIPYMKKLDLFLLFLLLPLDFLGVFLAGLAAYFLRFETVFSDWRPATQVIPFKEYLFLLFIISFVWLALFALSGLYQPRPKRFFDESVKIFFASSAGAILVISAIFFRREFFTSRFIILAGYVFSIIFVVFLRFLVNRLRHLLYKKGFGVKNVLIIGEGRLVGIIKNEFEENPHFGYRVKDALPRFAVEEIERRTKEMGLDEIILVGQSFTSEELRTIIEYTMETHLAVKYASDILGGQLFRIKSLTLAGIPFVEVKVTPLDGWGKIYKRIFDITFALLLVVLLAPVFVAIKLAIFLTSRGPIIYKNKRVGERGKEFNLYKFRSMYSDYCVGEQFKNATALELEKQLIAERGIKTGPVYKISNDPRVTSAGKWLRRYSLDELPQFFNVILGDMSLVGPRPHQPREVEKYQRAHCKILNIRPGITGLSQISGRSDLTFNEEARLDFYYIENWSPLLDLYILLKTPGVVLSKKGAY